MLCVALSCLFVCCLLSSGVDSGFMEGGSDVQGVEGQ